MSADDDRRRSGPLRPAARPSGSMPTMQRSTQRSTAERPAASGPMPTMPRPAARPSTSGPMPTVQRSPAQPTAQRPGGAVPQRPSGAMSQPSPRAPAPPTEQPRRPSGAHPATPATARPSGKLVLVVEDDEKTRRLLGHVMHKGGYRVALAEDGIKAAGVLKKARPDLILLDLRMPRMDGFQLLTLLARFKSAASIPVVVLTASDSPIDLDRALQLGVADYLQKPISPKALLLKVRALLKSPA